MVDILSAVILGACTLCAAVIQGTFTYYSNKKIHGIKAKTKDTGKADKICTELKSLEQKAKELKEQEKGIRTTQHEAVKSYRNHVTALMLLSLLYGVASIYLPLRYPDDSLWLSVIMPLILFLFALGVAFRTALTKLEKISLSTWDIRRRQRDLQKQVTGFRAVARKPGSFGELSDRMDRQIAELEKSIAEARELSTSKDKQAISFVLFSLPLAACAVVCGRCIPGRSLSQLVQLHMGSVVLWLLASTHPTLLLLSTILQGCILMLIYSGKGWD